MAPSASPSVASAAPTPSPTPTWDAKQAAAVKAVEGSSAELERIGLDPSAFTKKQMTAALGEFTGGNALDSTVGFLMLLKENDYRRVGSVVDLQVLATKVVDNGRGDEVHVTVCRDQRSVKIVDKDGETVTGDDFAIPEYNLRQFSVRKPPGEDAFLVFGYETINGVCP
ncbi:MAG: hypothetical protein VB036_10090 [Propionicimonas sp.]|nr:hypothetical protein [Propionicimonas sp.]